MAAGLRRPAVFHFLGRAWMALESVSRPARRQYRYEADSFIIK